MFSNRLPTHVTIVFGSCKSNNLLLVDERSVSVLSSPTSKIGMYGVIRPTQMTAAQQISGEPNNTLKPLDVPTYGQLNLDLT